MCLCYSLNCDEAGGTYASLIVIEIVWRQMRFFDRDWDLSSARYASLIVIGICLVPDALL